MWSRGAWRWKSAKNVFTFIIIIAVKIIIIITIKIIMMRCSISIILFFSEHCNHPGQQLEVGTIWKNDHYSLSLSQKSPDDFFAEHIALNIVVVYFVKLCKHSLVITQDGFTLSATMSTAMMETSGTKRYCQYKLSSSSSFLTFES